MCCSKYKYKCTNTSVGQDHEGGFHNRSIKFVVEEDWGLKFKVEFPPKDLNLLSNQTFPKFKI